MQKRMQLHRNSVHYGAALGVENGSVEPLYVQFNMPSFRSARRDLATESMLLDEGDTRFVSHFTSFVDCGNPRIHVERDHAPRLGGDKGGRDVIRLRACTTG